MVGMISLWPRRPRFEYCYTKASADVFGVITALKTSDKNQSVHSRENKKFERLLIIEKLQLASKLAANWVTREKKNPQLGPFFFLFFQLAGNEIILFFFSLTNLRQIWIFFPLVSESAAIVVAINSDKKPNQLRVKNVSKKNVFSSSRVFGPCSFIAQWFDSLAPSGSQGF